MSIFFFKQKTAYEMRISDWSSDVCSSDLQATGVADVAGERLRSIAAALLQRLQAAFGLAGSGGEVGKQLLQPAARGTQGGELAIQRHGITDRSEEHTSELQSLMRISYAVFCLKKKKSAKDKHTYTIQ